MNKDPTRHSGQGHRAPGGVKIGANMDVARRKGGQGTRQVSGPAGTLLRVIEWKPEAVKRTPLSA